jgi:hypothetical protein
MGFHTRETIENYMAAANKSPGEFLFDGRRGRDRPIPTRQYSRLVSHGIASIGLALLWDACAEPRLLSSTAALVRDSGKCFSSAPSRDVSLARRTGRVEQLAVGNNDAVATVKKSSCACSSDGEMNSLLRSFGFLVICATLIAIGLNGETI